MFFYYSHHYPRTAVVSQNKAALMQTFVLMPVICELRFSVVPLHLPPAQGKKVQNNLSSRRFLFFLPLLVRWVCLSQTSKFHHQALLENGKVAKFCIQLFRERFSEKVHATIPKGILFVLGSLFFAEIWNKGTRGHGHMFASAKGKQQK